MTNHSSAYARNGLPAYVVNSFIVAIEIRIARLTHQTGSMHGDASNGYSRVR